MERYYIRMYDASTPPLYSRFSSAVFTQYPALAEANGKGTRLREETMTEFEGQVLADLSVLQSQMKQLIGIGQPGRMTQLEERVERHERGLQRLKGVASAVGGLLTIFHVAIDCLRR